MIRETTEKGKQQNVIFDMWLVQNALLFFSSLPKLSDFYLIYLSLQKIETFCCLGRHTSAAIWRSISPLKPIFWSHRHKNGTIIWSDTPGIFLSSWFFQPSTLASKYSQSIMVLKAEMPLLTGLNEKRHSRGTIFKTQSNSGLKQLLSAVPSIIYQ